MTQSRCGRSFFSAEKLRLVPICVEADGEARPDAGTTADESFTRPCVSVLRWAIRAKSRSLPRNSAATRCAISAANGG